MLLNIVFYVYIVRQRQLFHFEIWKKISIHFWILLKVDGVGIFLLEQEAKKPKFA